MKFFHKLTSWMMLTIGAASALAAPSDVQFSTTGNSNYNIRHIRQFDWQSSGDLVVVDKLPGPVSAGPPSAVVTCGTFACWAANAVAGQSVTFSIHTHARLVNFIGTNGQSLSPATLSTDGANCIKGSNCFEVTIALSGETSATLLQPGLLGFDSIIANYTIFSNSPPDSNVTTTNPPSPTNFANGTPILQGTSFAISGRFGGSGLDDVQSAISTYNSNYIQADTPGLVQLDAVSFINLIQLVGGGQAQIAVGQPIGLAPYTVLTADLLYKIDSNSQFDALPKQPLGACRVTGGGNDVDTNLVISRNVNIAFPNTAILQDKYTFNKDSPNSYTYGGQVGAPAVPFGEWTHHQKDGQTADFVFHAGTHSAPKDTVITDVVCNDPGACVPAAAKADFHQIDFQGTGSFRAIAKGMNINGFNAVVDHDPSGGTRHYFRVHIEDLGEPGGSGGPKPNSCGKVPGAITATGDCKNCPDIYQIEIHAGPTPESAIIYTVGGFVNGGNLQIHPPVGQ